MNNLEVYTEIVNWTFIIYLLIAALNTNCFSALQWILTFIVLLFSYFMRYVSKIEITETISEVSQKLE